MANIAPKSFWILALTLSVFCCEVSALTIYRFGGESQPAPPELSAEGGEGVEFVQLQWTEPDGDLGGSVHQVDMTEGIHALELDPNVNIAPSFAERGGELGRFFRDSNPQKYAAAFDGDLTTAYSAPRYLCSESVWGCIEYARQGSMGLRLGGEFFIDRLRIVSGLVDPGATVQILRMSLTPGATSESGKFAEGFEIRDNREQFLVIPITHDKRISTIDLTLAEHNRAWEVVEVEVYAKGFMDISTYVSERFDFGGPAAWGELRWSGFKDPDAELLIRTRSGADDDPNVYWKYTGRGDEKVEVTGSQHSKLKLGESAGTTYDLDNWTFWSAPYDFADSSGAAVVSLSPRQYLQFKVDMIPENESGCGLDFLELRVSSPPAATELLGEIFPFEVGAGQTSRFTYAVKPTLKGDDTGFDRLAMTTSTTRILSVDSVRVDKEAVPYGVEALEDHRFEVSLPRVTREESGALVEVVFQAQVLRYGATFDAWVRDSSRPLEVPQGVTAGDATLNFDGNTVAVATSTDSLSLLEVTVAPRIFTPNGDGVNDGTLISYDLLESVGEVPMTIEIRDLAGRLVRTVYSGADMIGHYERTWDGTDDSGDRVPPGVYLYRASLDVDKDRAEKVGTLNVAY